MALLRVTVKPRAHKDALCSFDEAGLLTVSVTAAPAEGQANKAVALTIARALNIPKTSVAVIRGTTSRVKTVEVKNISDEELQDRLKELFS